MTNTLHRQGTHESLSKDYVIFLHPSQGINRQGCAEKLKRFIRMALEDGAVNIGVNKENLFTQDPESMIAGITDESSATATFSDLEKLRRLVARLKQADMGLSINISGLANEVDEILRSQGIIRHSIEHSIGVLGKTERLPSRQILELTTMCGHGMISYNHARKMIDLVKLGKLTPKQAASYLARPCACGAFNVARAEELLTKAIEIA